MKGLGSELTKAYHPTVKLSGLKVLAPLGQVVMTDGNALKSNSRSSVGTYLGSLPEFRKYYANLDESFFLGLEPGHFSFNSQKGQCPTCRGKGVLEADMRYFESVFYPCPDCQGRKLRPSYGCISNGIFSFYEIVKKTTQRSSILPRE